MQITEIAFSCYPVTDMARARKFYEQVLGLKATQLTGEPGGIQWTEYNIAHGTLSIGAGAPGWNPTAEGCSVGLEVDDFDAAIAHLRTQGVKFHMEPFSTPVCRMAFISEGLQLSSENEVVSKKFKHKHNDVASNCMKMSRRE